MELCKYILILVALQFKSLRATEKVYRINEETGKDAYIGNIPQDLKLPPLSSTDTQRTYKILKGGDKVRLDAESGDLSTVVNLDREEVCPKKSASQNAQDCVIDIEVAIIPSDPSKIFNQVKIVLKDINDNTPRFPNDEVIEKEISESAATGSLIRLDSAVDPDIGFNSIQRYEIASSPPNRRDKNGISVPFFQLETIENSDGTKIPQLVLSKKLDREKISSYELLLYAIDGGTPSLTGTATVLISVTDANDNQPSFSRSSYDVPIPEDVEAGYVVIQLEATDLDSGPNARIAYSFPSIVSAEEREVFNLDEDTGVLSISEAGLDYEHNSIHHLTVEAKDRGPNPASAYTTVTVKVQDVNDEAPYIDINFMDTVVIKGDGATDGSSKAVAIKENINVGFLLAFVTVTDRDTGVNGNVSCKMEPNANFEMIGLGTGKNRYLIKTKGELDRETKRFHNIEIEATDLGHPPLRSSTIVEVELLDENDNDPSFGKSLYELSVSENVRPGDEIAELKAEDLDDGINAEISYSVKPKLNGSSVPFAMNPKTGGVYFLQDATPLDAENRTKPYLLTVVATDNGNPRRSTTTTLEIKVADENDNSPKFAQKAYVFRINEDEKLGKYLGSVSAEDKDIDKATNGKVTYRFSGEETAFSIKGETGGIYFSGEPSDLDRESRNSKPYKLKVIAEDHGANPRTSQVDVDIFLLDVNDNKPIILSPNVSQDVEFLFIKPPLPTTADLLSPQENPTSSDDVFDEELEGVEGLENSTANPFPNISIKKVRKSSLKDALLIRSSSKITHFPSASTVVISQIKAKDIDDGKNGQVRYTLVEGNTYNYFGVDMHLGSVTLKIKDEKSLRKMKRGCHVIKVNVNDLGKPSEMSPAWVNIYVTDASPSSVNSSNAMKACRNNTFYPSMFLSPGENKPEEELSLLVIIAIAAGGFLLILLIVIIVVVIRCKGRRNNRKARTYNCKNAANTYDTGYSQGSPLNTRRKTATAHHMPNGTVDSRSSFYSEWTASQMQMTQHEKGEMIRHEDMPDGSVRSHNSGRDSGTGDSMPSDAYHTTGPGAHRQPYQNQPYQRHPQHPQSYGHPQNQPSQVYLPPQDDLITTDEESRLNGRAYLPNQQQMVFTSKCTKECRLYGHGDNCWMPDSLQRPSSRMAPFNRAEEFDGDSLKYKKRAMTPNQYQDQVRYTSAPSKAPYYYETGNNFEDPQQHGNFNMFHDNHVGSGNGSPAHSQVAASNLSRQPTSGYRQQPYSTYGQVQQPMYTQSPVPFNTASPTPYNGQPRSKAYVNLQGGGYDRNAGIIEDLHNNLANTGSGTQLHAKYQNPQGYSEQYPQDPSYPAPYPSGYDTYVDQGGLGMYGNPSHEYIANPTYEDNFAASNLLLSPADSEPGDYKLRLERQMRQQQQQNQRQPTYNYGNQQESDGRRLLDNEQNSLEQGEEGASTDKLSTIREELDADEVVAGIDGLLL